MVVRGWSTNSLITMARSGRVVIPVVLLAVALLASRSSVFVPAPSSNRLPAAAVAVPALLAGAPAAFADAIGDAAAKFSDATYPIAKKIDWGNTPIISNYFATECSKSQGCGKGCGCFVGIWFDDGSQTH